MERPRLPPPKSARAAMAFGTLAGASGPYPAKSAMVALARAFLDDPHWPWHAAAALGVDIDYVRQYARSHPKLWPGRVIASSTPTGR